VIEDSSTPLKEGMPVYNIFVYGTLMRGERANSYLSAAKYVGEFRLKDYAL
jgi:gamma-glutamylcyclotransferase (GGCT)/AIG2-like uncharacterized protein YtfP